MHGYFGMALSYVHEDKLQTRVVAFRRFLGSHTGERIAGMFSKVICDFSVKEKICSLVTDNASNMVKAFKVSVHDPDMAGVTGQFDPDTDSIQRMGIQWENVQDDINFTLPERHACLAHTIQLVVNDGMKEAADRIKQVISKCKTLTASIHMSAKATEVLESEGVNRIPSPNATRWNSTFLMISAIVKIESHTSGLLTRVADTIGSSVQFGERDRATLKELCLLLEPFRNATVRLEAKSVPTSGLALPVIIGITNAV